MSASGGSKAIIAAFLANMGIALAKFIAWALSGSASMLAEAIHSVADSGNQLLLMLGGRKAQKQADRAHPFGYGRERYVSAFVVSIALESYSLRTAVKESNAVREKGQSWMSFVRRSKAPELPVVLLEDTGALTGLTFALLGVGLTLITGDPLFDALGTLMIGLLLIVIALILGAETKSLLVGEGATQADYDRIVDAISGGPDVQKLIHIKTLYLGPDELMVAAKIALAADKSVRDAAADIDEIERRIRAAVPAARVIYLEPDVYRPSLDPEPPTDAFVLKSSD
jgi:divalent metal cation (Fe/Co/Zn/Cd) transporter